MLINDICYDLSVNYFVESQSMLFTEANLHLQVAQRATSSIDVNHTRLELALAV